MTLPSFDLHGRNALVTGASSGLGARFAEALAGAGAQVIACGRRIERLEALAADVPDLVALQGDVTSEADRERVVGTAVDRFGRIDVCVNNAGTSSGGPERQAELDSFRAVVRLNLEAVFGMCQLVAEHMRARRSGSIVNIGSMFGHVASTPVPDAGYAASKAAVNGLTRELANQWAADGVRVNAIAPGWFPSEMTDELLADERSRRWLERQCPMGRIGRVDELDGILLFLASDASSYCTGQVIAVDGGWTIR